MIVPLPESTGKVICPVCAATGERSRVTYEHKPMREAVYIEVEMYYDEDGDWHQHDPMPNVASFVCSKGHRWSDHQPKACSTEGCEWNATLPDAHRLIVDGPPERVQG